jgi:hypothetical protein
MHGRIAWLGSLLVVVAACGSSSGASDDGGGGDTLTDAPIDGDVPEEVADAPDGEGGDVADGGDIVRPPLTGIALPQAVGGAMWANPAVYDEIPLHVAVDGSAASVSVAMDGGAPIDATDPADDGDWVAMLPIGELPDGEVSIDVTALGHAAERLDVSGVLLLGRSGVQLTVFGTAGVAATPLLHRVGDALWLTWADRSAGDREAWLRGIDGAGRWTTDPTPLVRAAEETLYARTAVGDETLGILYQARGGPYVNRFKTVEPDGTERFAPIDLDPAGWFGAYGGDVVFDGSGFVAVWRSYDGAGAAEIRWMRVDEATGAVTGPVVVAAAGAGTAADPIGGFDPFVHLDVAALEDRSLVGFARYRYDGMLDMAIPKAQLALVEPDGTVVYREYAGIERAMTWDRECRVFALHDGFVAIWSSVSLTDPADDPPNAFYAARTGLDGTLDPERRGGVHVFDAPDDRDEPFLVPGPDPLGTLLWFDHRAYTLEPARGRIELYAASMGDDLTTGDEVVLPHARTIAGTSLPNGTAAGTNVLLVWLDERHGSGILDPRPEVYFETIWR